MESIYTKANFAKFFDKLSMKEISEVIVEKQALSGILDNIGIVNVAQVIRQKDNYIDKLRDQIHTLQVEALSLKAVDCRADALGGSGKQLNLVDQPAFKLDDEYFSS